MAPSVFANAILDHGTEEQAALLPLFCDQSYATGAVALTEAGPLSDASRPQTQAEQKGEQFILSGRKTFVARATARVTSS